MKAIDIELFGDSPLVCFEYKGSHIDLHNNFNCCELRLENDRMTFTFQEIQGPKKVQIVFERVILKVLNLVFLEKDDMETIVLFYRGGYVYEGNCMYVVDEVKAYFYCDFYEGLKLEFFAEEVSILVDDVIV